jgi:hypothetical protein
MNKILSEKEYDALDYHLQHAKLYDSGLYIQQELNRGDYFVDEENNCEYSLEEGLRIIADTINPDIYYNYPMEVCATLHRLYYTNFGINILDGGFNK